MYRNTPLQAEGIQCPKCLYYQVVQLLYCSTDRNIKKLARSDNDDNDDNHTRGSCLVRASSMWINVDQRTRGISARSATNLSSSARCAKMT